MFAYSPFGSVPFASLGSSGPAFVSSTMTAIGKGLMDAYANWFQDSSPLFEGRGFYDPRFQLLRDSSIKDKGVGNFVISATSYMNSVLEAKGFATATYVFQYFANTKLLASGVGTADFAPGYKMYSTTSMNGKASFSSPTGAMFQSTLVAKGLATFQGYTAYVHTTRMSVRGIGTVIMDGGRAIATSFQAKGVGNFKVVAVYPGDDEADFYSKGIGNFYPKGAFTASFGFKSYGSSSAVFIMNALYQGVGEFEGVATTKFVGASKYSSGMRVMGVATTVFNTQFAQVFDSLVTASGKGLFNPKFGFFGNSKLFIYGIATTDFKTEFAKKESAVLKATGIGTFRAYFLANAITSVTMLGVGTFKINTYRVINSYSLFRGIGYVDFKPGNPLYAYLPPAEDVFKIPLDKFHDLKWTDDMHVGKVIKQPIERKDYDIDFKDWLFQRDAEDTLNGLDYEVVRIAGCGADTTPLMVDLMQITATTAKVWVRGGTNGSSYKVELTVNTVRGRVDQSELTVYVENT